MTADELAGRDVGRILYEMVTREDGAAGMAAQPQPRVPAPTQGQVLMGW